MRAAGPTQTNDAAPVPGVIAREAGGWEAVKSRRAAPLYRTARPTLQVGDSVRHAQFGEGVVTACDVTAADTEVTVEFEGGVGVKRLLLSFAPLEKVG